VDKRGDVKKKQTKGFFSYSLWNGNQKDYWLGFGSKE